LPFYLAEWSYKYNRRQDREEMFGETIEHAVTDEKPMLDYKPTKSPIEITTGDAVRAANEREERTEPAKRDSGNVKSKLRKSVRKKNKPKRIEKKAKIHSKSKGKIVRETVAKKTIKKKLATKIKRISANKKQVKKPLVKKVSRRKAA